MRQYKLCGKFVTEAENRDKLLAILCAAADLMATAEGCLSYTVWKIDGDDTAVWVDELWESQTAHDNSLSIAGVSDLIQQARPLIRGIEQFKLLPARAD